MVWSSCLHHMQWYVTGHCGLAELRSVDFIDMMKDSKVYELVERINAFFSGSLQHPASMYGVHPYLGKYLGRQVHKLGSLGHLDINIKVRASADRDLISPTIAASTQRRLGVSGFPSS